MKTLVVTFAFLSSLNTFAAPSIILEKIQASGFVMPQYRFAKNCKIASNGRMRIEIKKPNEMGEWESKVTNIQLTSKMVQTINNLLKGAAMGEIVEVPMPCDVGTSILHGKYKNQEVEIDSARDCHSHIINKSGAAARLKEISNELCQF